MRSKATGKPNEDKHSLPLIWIGVLVGIGIAIFISFKYYFPITVYALTNYIGLGLIVIGVVLRLLIIRSLGNFFTVAVTTIQNHKLKTDGFYKLLRHPSYAASLLSFIGFGVSLNNWVSLVIITAVISTVFIYRIKIEEQALIGFSHKNTSIIKKQPKHSCHLFIDNRVSSKLSSV